MLGWIWRMLIGSFSTCEHQWVVFNHVEITNEFKSKIGDEYYLKCSKCGEIKSKKFF